MKKESYVVGLMSGTSLDGIDSALINIVEMDGKIEVKLIDFINEPLEEELKEKIKRALSKESSNVELICSLNFELGYAFSNAVKNLCKKANFDIDKLDIIGSHGQTIFHIPKAYGEHIKSTLQIGEPAIIAYETETTVISNFRTMDMAAGGQGAPLVPYTEYLLYRGDKNRILQNIGGIGNATVLPRYCKLEDVYAFDTGPGNMIIDEVTKNLKGISYDKDGYFASIGNIKQDLLNELMSIEYISMKPPKTTGRELFGKQLVDCILNKYGDLKAEDIIATMTMFTAKSIAYNYKKFIFPKLKIDEVILGGGGSYNKTLIKMLKEELKDVKVLIQEDLGLSSDAKEAVAFALLAYETVNRRAGNVLGATGASKRVILGNITLPPI